MPIEHPYSSLILASGSRYRRELLERLGAQFTCISPDIDESRQPGEPPDALARRLAESKAGVISAAHPDALIIGSDQVASLAGDVLGKPGTVANAVAQLLRCSGRDVEFYTAVHICCGATGFSSTHVDRTVVTFRTLSEADCAAYVEAEQPLDCAGSFKSEGLGVVLMERIRNDDPTALIGLPLIWVSGALHAAGYPLLNATD